MIKRITIYIFIPFLLLLTWLFMSIFFVPQTRLSIISYYHGAEDINNFSTSKLVKGKMITGQIKAEDNHFGIISIRFSSPKVAFEDEDTLIFKIKEKGSKKWLQTNTYRSGLFYENPLFPFGFSRINDSLGKTYYFEIASLHGNDENALSLSKDIPVMATQYEFKRSEVLSSKWNLISFFEKKIRSLFSNPISLSFSIPYFLPFCFYVAFLFLRKKVKFLWFGFEKFIDSHFHLSSYLDLRSYFLFHLVLFLMIIDLFLNYTNLHFTIFFIFLGFWVLTLNYYKLNSNITIAVSFLFLLIAFVANIYQDEYLLQKASSWAYLLIFTGVVQYAFSLREKADKREGIIKVIKTTFKFL